MQGTPPRSRVPIEQLVARIGALAPPYTASPSRSHNASATAHTSHTTAASCGKKPPGLSPTTPASPIHIIIDNSTSITGHGNTLILSPASPPASPSTPGTSPTTSPTASAPSMTSSLPTEHTESTAAVTAPSASSTGTSEQVRRAVMLSHVLSNIPSSQNRAVHVKVQGGVKICGSRNLVVSGGRVDGKRAVERIGMVREGIDRVPMGGISEDWVGAGRKRRAEEEPKNVKREKH
ncbi:hypothetical protein MMC19_001059 [Ptychographa xylographoides]|nr:hypothetical protein [Ptychographa xylographoides]